MTVTLSIAIPTYNGSRYIRGTLDSIVAQLEDVAQEVEIVVSDNASTDQTPEIIREYQQKYPAIKYFRNDENYGTDRNADLAVRRATGNYIWFLGDDDRMAAGGIRKVLDVVNGNPELGMIYMNCKTFSWDFSECLAEKVIDVETDTLFEDADSFFQKIGTAAGLLPSSIVRRDLWISTDRSRYEGSNWLHLATLFIMLPGHRSYLIAKPYSLYRSGSFRWLENGASAIMFMTLFDIIKSLPEYGYQEQTIKIMLDSITKGTPMWISVAKEHGLPVNPALIKKLVARFGSSPRFWLLGFPLLLLPNCLHRAFWKVCTTSIVKRIYKGIKRKLST